MNRRRIIVKTNRCISSTYVKYVNQIVSPKTPRQQAASKHGENAPLRTKVTFSAKITPSASAPLMTKLPPKRQKFCKTISNGIKIPPYFAKNRGLWPF